MKNYLLFNIFLSIMTTLFAVHDSLNFLLEAKTRACFYDEFEKGDSALLIETFVEAGGNMYVHFQTFGPLTTEQVLAEDFEDYILNEPIDALREAQSDTQTFTHTFNPKKPGIYAFCLDNRQARFVPKQVQIDIRLAPRPEPVRLRND